MEDISRRLQAELPGLRGFSATSMKKMRLFYEAWTDGSCRPLPTDDLAEIHCLSSCKSEPDASVPQNRPLPTDDLPPRDTVSFLATGFTHHMEILSKCKEAEERWYYIRRCAAEFWSVEALRSHLRADEFRHEGALTNNFVLTLPDAEHAARAVRAFKDEYLLDFINIEDADDEADVDERVLENALVAEIRRFIQSLGADFCFIGNQHRIIVEEEESFIDMLFYHRALRCLVAVELKRGKFKPAYLGQLNYYLSALDDQERKPDENQSIGLLLCKEAKRGVVELAIRDFNKPLGVAIYRTGREIPEPYQALIPLVTGVKKILSEETDHV